MPPKVESPSSDDEDDMQGIMPPTTNDGSVVSSSSSVGTAASQTSGKLNSSSSSSLDFPSLTTTSAATTMMKESLQDTDTTKATTTKEEEQQQARANLTERLFPSPTNSQKEERRPVSKSKKHISLRKPLVPSHRRPKPTKSAMKSSKQKTAAAVAVAAPISPLPNKTGSLHSTNTISPRLASTPAAATASLSPMASPTPSPPPPNDNAANTRMGLSPRMQRIMEYKIARSAPKVVSPKPPPTKAKTKAAVQFAPKIHIRPTIHVADMSEKLIDSVWYAYNDYRAMKDEVQRTAKAITSGRDLIQEEDDYYQQLLHEGNQQHHTSIKHSGTNGTSIKRHPVGDDDECSSSDDSEDLTDEKADTFAINQSLVQHDIELLCSRGCETKTKEGSRWRSQHKLAAWVAVLDEQDRQYDLGIYCDWHQLSYEYQMVTRPCTNRALMRGMKDQQDVAAYMRDVREEWYGSNNDEDGKSNMDGHNNMDCHHHNGLGNSNRAEGKGGTREKEMEELNQSFTSIDLGGSSLLGNQAGCATSLLKPTMVSTTDLQLSPPLLTEEVTVATIGPAPSCAEPQDNSTATPSTAHTHADGDSLPEHHSQMEAKAA